MPKSRVQQPSRHYVDVVPAIPLSGTATRAYTYHLPTDPAMQAEIYTRVTVPFGKRQVPGVVIGEHRERVSYQTKEAIPTSPVQLTARQVAFAQWISSTMHGSFGFTLRLFFPAAKKPLPAALKKSPVTKRTTARLSSSTASLPQALIDADSTRRLTRLTVLVGDVVTQGRQVLVLVPERWMLAPTSQALHGAMASATIATVDATLTPVQYTTVWHNVQRGNVSVIVGTQKALFLPFHTLGLVVIEEEAYPTHKLWDQYPRLHNVRAAAHLASLHQARVVYSGSFPSLQLHHRLQAGEVTSLHSATVTPRPRIVPVSVEDRLQHRLVPQRLLQSLSGWLGRGETVVLLHNARGSWQTVVCRRCGKALRCPTCQVALTLHAGKQNRVFCHHDGFSQKVPTECPACHHPKLITIGAGTEKVHDILTQLFPRSRLTRFDADTVAGSPAFVPAASAAGHIIVGTNALFTALVQTTVDRALYFLPERGLLYPDFRSAERTMINALRLQQLLPSRRQVHFVTRRPAVVAPLTQPLAQIYAAWLRERKQLNYPPYTDLVQLTVQNKVATQAATRARRIRELLEGKEATNITIRGPYTGFIKRQRGYYQQHLLLSGPLQKLRELYRELPVDTVDVDPERIL